PGQSSPILIRNIYRSELEELLRSAVSKLNPKASGLYNIDLKYNTDNKPCITEFNLGRFYYNMPLFNAGDKPLFDYYMKTFLESMNLPFYKNLNEFLFIREQDKAPFVTTELEVKRCLNKAI